MLGISWFWFFGTALTAQLPLYAQTNLGGASGLFLLTLGMFSVGTGIGSLLCEKLSGRAIEIGLVPLGAFGISAFAIDLYFARPGLAPVGGLGVAAFVRAAGSARILSDLTLIGVFGGFFLVPLFAMVQSRSPRSELSRVIAATTSSTRSSSSPPRPRGSSPSTCCTGHPAVLPGAGDRQHVSWRSTSSPWCPSS